MESDPDEYFHPGQEKVKWNKGEKPSQDDVPEAKYSKITQQARKIMPGYQLCRMFCGGKKCKYCSNNWPKDRMAIDGLYSEWVTENILAMARPSNYGFDNFSILDQFVAKGIKTVINLQQPGEHSACGQGNDSSGFSYSPQRLMEKQLYFYNYTLEDYGVASMSTLLDIVKVMQFAVSQGKVAVHCHAGLGRTGLLIACFLVFNNRISSGEAIHYVRSKRRGAIQTSSQVQAVYDFEKHLQPFRTIFPSRVPNGQEVSFKHFLNRQGHVLHGFEARRLRYIPKVIYMSCERLLELAGRGNALSRLRNSSAVTRMDAFLKEYKAAPKFVRSQDNVANSSVLEAANKPDTVANRPGSTALRIKSLEDLNNETFKHVLSQHSIDDSSSESSLNDNDEDYYISEDITNYSYDDYLGNEKSSTSFSEKHFLSNDKISRNSVKWTEIVSDNTTRVVGPELVCRAMGATEYSESARARADLIETQLNLTDDAWSLIACEPDPLVLSAVIWDWLDQLREPVLHRQDLNLLLEKADKPIEALEHTEKAIKHFIEYLARVCLRLFPQAQDVETRLVERLLSHLTHHCVEMQLSSFTHKTYMPSHWLMMKSNDSVRLMKFFFQLLEEESQAESTASSTFR